MYLHNLQLFQFKNHPDTEYPFRQRITGICGPNGTGKTNLLDAIYFLCFTRSYFSKSDAASTRHGQSGFRIAGDWNLEDQRRQATVILRETGKKEVAVDGETYAKISSHIGRFPCIMIAPDDVELITGGSEERRKFADMLLSQINPDYLAHLMQYTRVLQQRNSYLKSAYDSGQTDYGLLDIYDLQLAQPGNHIHAERKRFFSGFVHLVNRIYREIAGDQETITIEYTSPLDKAPLEEILAANRQRDLMMQRTGSGIHRDELIFTLQGQPFKSIASQGQRKSLLFALKLAACEVIREIKGFPPLLLLDDVFEKLDENRMHNLLQKVCVLQTGQVFITDTHRDRLESALRKLGADFDIIDLRQ